MKNILLLVLFFNISYHLNAQSGWFTLQSGVSTFLWKMSFVNPQTGYIASDGGQVLKTTNSGNNWIIQTLNPSVNVYAIHFIDINTGYTAGSQGKLFKTTNGGIVWNLLNSPTGNTIQTLFFLDVDNGFIGGGGLYKTTNGGNNWVQYGQNAFFSTIMSLSFPSANTGYAASYNGTVEKTTNGGINWIVQNTGLDSLSPLFGVYFIDTGNGFGACSAGKIIKTSNGGSNWNTVLNSSYAVVSVFFPNTLTGYAVGGNFTDKVVFRTTNGGINWISEVLSIPGHANNILFSTVTEGYISCEAGVIYKTTNGGNPIGILPISSDVPERFELFQNYPNPFNPSTKIRFSIPPYKGRRLDSSRDQGDVSLKIYDLLGREVAALINESAAGGLYPGVYEVEWNSSKFSSGIYFYTLTAGNFRETKKMVLIK